MIKPFLRCLNYDKGKQTNCMWHLFFLILSYSCSTWRQRIKNCVAVANTTAGRFLGWQLCLGQSEWPMRGRQSVVFTVSRGKGDTVVMSLSLVQCVPWFSPVDSWDQLSHNCDPSPEHAGEDERERVTVEASLCKNMSWKRGINEYTSDSFCCIFHIVHQ